MVDRTGEIVGGVIFAAILDLPDSGNVDYQLRIDLGERFGVGW